MNMTDTTNLDQLRGAVLDKIERTERNYRLAFWAAAGVESLFLVGFLALADLSNRLHLLLLLAAMAIYSIVVLGLVALGAHVSRCTERLLKAIELFGRGCREREDAQR
jgi:hypothetical protein